MSRLDGYYWVRYSWDDSWETARWDSAGDRWWTIGDDDCCQDKNIHEIGSKIEPPKDV